jgi:hypothetical protein
MTASETEAVDMGMTGISRTDPSLSVRATTDHHRNAGATTANLIGHNAVALQGTLTVGRS